MWLPPSSRIMPTHGWRQRPILRDKSIYAALADSWRFHAEERNSIRQRPPGRDTSCVRDQLRQYYNTIGGSLPTPMSHVSLSLLALRDHIFGYAMEDGPERQVVGGFESARQQQRQPQHDQRPLKQHARENRAGGRASAPGERGHAGRRRPLRGSDQRHCIRLARRHI